MKIRKGDKVIVISGKDRGLSGKVLHAYPKTQSLIVEGVNLKKRHRKPTKSGQHGQIIDKANPIHISNVQLVDPKENKPTRVRYEEKKGKKVRVAVKSGTELAS
jgi:large subunit ribosomal protein L24